MKRIPLGKTTISSYLKVILKPDFISLISSLKIVKLGSRSEVSRSGPGADSIIGWSKIIFCSRIEPTFSVAIAT